MKVVIKFFVVKAPITNKMVNELTNRRKGKITFESSPHSERQRFVRKVSHGDDETVGTTLTDEGATFSIQKKLYIRDMDTKDLCSFLKLVANLKQSRKIDKRQHLQTMTGDGVLVDAFGQLTRDLLAEYCARTRQQVREWLRKSSSSLEHCEEVLSTANHNLATNGPEDIMYILQIQMSVARELLPSVYCSKVMVTILEEIHKMQEKNRLFLSKTTPGAEGSIEIEQICAFISDCTCMYEQLDNLACKDYLCGTAPVTRKLKGQMDKVLLEYVSLAIYASGILAQTIFFDLKPILSKIHTSHWEHGDQIRTVLCTLRDYFQDIKLWIPDYFFAKFIRKCLETLRHMYLKSFFSKGYLKARTVNAITAAALLERDRLNLLQFFSQECFELRQTGLTDVGSRLEILRAMSKVLSAIEPSDVSTEINVILKELGYRNGKNAIIFLAKKSGNRRQKLHKWKIAVSDNCGINSNDFTAQLCRNPLRQIKGKHSFRKKRNRRAQ